MTGQRYAARWPCGAPNATACLPAPTVWSASSCWPSCSSSFCPSSSSCVMPASPGATALDDWRFLAATFGGRRFLLGRFPFRRHVDPGAPCFRKTDGYRLLGGPCAVLAFAHMLDLFAHEFTGLCGRRLSFPLFLAGTFDGFLLRHDQLLCYLYPSIHREYRSRN